MKQEKGIGREDSNLRPPAPKAVARSPFTTLALSSQKAHINSFKINGIKNSRALARSVKGGGVYPQYCLRPVGRTEIRVVDS